MIDYFMIKEKRESDKKGQVWIETAIYTLIGLVIIGIILSVAMPQINKIQDKSIITQTIEALNELDNKLLSVGQDFGSVGVVNFRVGKGKLEIDPNTDTITYILEETRLELSEPGEVIKEGPISLETEEYGSRFKIILSMDYSTTYNITYEGDDVKIKTLQATSTPYKIQIENLGGGITENVNMDFNVI
jgi:type II secretory pathway pseudopilin PulG